MQTINRFDEAHQQTLTYIYTFETSAGTEIQQKKNVSERKKTAKN